MKSSGEGLRAGTDGSFQVQFKIGTRIIDLTGYTVAVAAKLAGGTEFAPTITPIDATKARYRVSCTAAQLTGPGDLSCEFTFTGGSEPVNPNAKPLIVPVRAEYGVAS